MPRYVTIIGLIAAICGAIGPEVTNLNATAGKVIAIIGLAAVAAGRSLLPKRKSSRTVRSIAGLVLVGLVLSTTACPGQPSGKTLVAIASAGQQIAAGIAANRGLPDELLAEGLITKEVRDRLVAGIAETEPLVKEFNDGMTEVLASEKPDLKKLAPVAANIADRIAAWPVVQNSRWSGALAPIRLGLRFVANYFALQVRSGRAYGLSDKQICRQAGIEYSPQMISTLESLAEKSDADAAAFVDRYMRAEAGG